MKWTHETAATWDADKQRIVGGAPAGTFDTRLTGASENELLPGDWFRAEDDSGKVVGYGWMDVLWGDAEILLATDPERQGEGIGSYVLDHLEEEARKQGLNYLTNVVRPTNPRADHVRRWLEKRGFERTEDGRLLRASSKKG